MSVVVFLNASEIGELDRQHPSTKAKGGWQGVLVGLQEMLDRKTLSDRASIPAIDAPTTSERLEPRAKSPEAVGRKPEAESRKPSGPN